MNASPHPNAPSLWRQGDVLFQSCAEVPPEAKPRRGGILFRGEATGHSHQLASQRGVRIFDLELPAGRVPEVFLSVKSDSCEIVHPEHRTITLAKGAYRVWQQREWSPQGPRTVVD